MSGCATMQPGAATWQSCSGLVSRTYLAPGPTSQALKQHGVKNLPTMHWARQQGCKWNAMQ